MIGLRPWAKIYRLRGNVLNPLPQLSISLLHIKLDILPRRSFSTVSVLRYPNIPTDQAALGHDASPINSHENTRSESVQKAQNTKDHEPPKADVLLENQTVSTKEQRKADWAIMKEMSRYLWPKVWQVRYLLLPQRLTFDMKDDLGTKVRVGTALTLLVGSKVMKFTQVSTVKQRSCLIDYRS